MDGNHCHCWYSYLCSLFMNFWWVLSALVEYHSTIVWLTHKISGDRAWENNWGMMGYTSLFPGYTLSKLWLRTSLLGKSSINPSDFFEHVKHREAPSWDQVCIPGFLLGPAAESSCYVLICFRSPHRGLGIRRVFPVALISKLGLPLPPSSTGFIKHG